MRHRGTYICVGIVQNRAVRFVKLWVCFGSRWSGLRSEKSMHERPFSIGQTLGAMSSILVVDGSSWILSTPSGSVCVGSLSAMASVLAFVALTATFDRLLERVDFLTGAETEIQRWNSSDLCCATLGKALICQSPTSMQTNLSFVSFQWCVADV